MIAKLTGVIGHIGLSDMIIDVNGVGYLVSVSRRTLGCVGQVGDNVSLLIDTIIREDQFSLFGFADASEQTWFRLLCSVQGVGAKAGLSILAVVSPDELPVVIAAQDKDTIRRADGVGPKLATRIVTELKDKAGDLALGASALQNNTKPTTAKGKAAAQTPISASQDAVSALVNLGYGRAEAFGVVSIMAKQLGEDVVVGDLIRESLKELSA